jgi:hypothetical protein
LKGVSEINTWITLRLVWSSSQKAGSRVRPRTGKDTHTLSDPSLSFPISSFSLPPPNSLSLTLTITPSLSLPPSASPHSPTRISSPEVRTLITSGLVMMSSCLLRGGLCITFGSTVSTPRLCKRYSVWCGVVWWEKVRFMRGLMRGGGGSG